MEPTVVGNIHQELRSVGHELRGEIAQSVLEADQDPKPDGRGRQRKHIGFLAFQEIARHEIAGDRLQDRPHRQILTVGDEMDFAVQLNRMRGIGATVGDQRRGIVIAPGVEIRQDGSEEQSAIIAALRFLQDELR